MSPERVDFISECFVKPHPTPEASKKPHHMTPWDLAMLSVHYIQKGLLYPKPNDPHFSMEAFLGKVESSLSQTLFHFYPLAGRLVTTKSQNPPFYSVFVDCVNSPGARLVRAKLDLTASVVLSSSPVPLIVQSLFDHDKALNHDGHEMALVTIQVTELVDGIFVGCSMNHAVGDGTSFWNFLTAWSEIFRVQDGINPPALRPSVHERWFPGQTGPVINLPFRDHTEFVNRYEAPLLVEKIFHVSAQSIARLKQRANSESDTEKISSFQSLSALVWRCITRTRRFPPDQVTSCRLAINNRPRLNPPLSPDYFGNAIQTVRGIATAGELLDHNLGWAAWQLHQAVTNHNDQKVREFLDSWIKSPFIYQLGQFFDPCSIMMGSSPRFNKYGIEFGLGKALALRSGYANKFDGKVTSYPGYEGGGSIDLEVCLPMDSMRALESDNEFMDAAMEGELKTNSFFRRFDRR